jgi:hypothetical protein
MAEAGREVAGEGPAVEEAVQVAEVTVEVATADQARAMMLAGDRTATEGHLAILTGGGGRRMTGAIQAAVIRVVTQIRMTTGVTGDAGGTILTANRIIGLIGVAVGTGAGGTGRARLIRTMGTGGDVAIRRIPMSIVTGRRSNLHPIPPARNSLQKDRHNLPS